MKMSNIKRLRKSIKSLNKAEKKLMKARAERIWIENNPHIHIFNYPYYKLKKIVFGDMR